MQYRLWNSKPTVVDLLELRAAANVFGWPESPELLAANS